MKILVLSDSHGCMKYMQQAIEKERPNLICHLGDGARDVELLRQRYLQTPILGVPGNCDRPAPDIPLTQITQEAGVRILLTHGHSYGVKSGLLRLRLAAQEAGCQIALFGHTHVPYCKQTEGVWLLNPGSCRTKLRYGVIAVENGQPLCYNVAMELAEEEK